MYMEYCDTNNYLLKEIITLFEITIYKYLKDKDIEGLLYGELKDNKCRENQEGQEGQEGQEDQENQEGQED